MTRVLHPALAFASLVESWTPGLFSHADRWHEASADKPWRYMTWTGCASWLSEWLRRHPPPEEGFISTP